MLSTVVAAAESGRGTSSDLVPEMQEPRAPRGSWLSQRSASRRIHYGVVDWIAEAAGAVMVTDAS
jgi:hypothetical protein